VHYADSQTGPICLENTPNLAGGRVMSTEHCADLCSQAHVRNLRVHLDGARIFNAAIATNSSVADLTSDCDSVQFCLSKGLGAPVGSVLVGSQAFIDEARIWRKRFGGGMRQAGIIAAAGLIALEESPKRLHEDHEKAQTLAVGISEIPGITLDAKTVETNIVIFDITGTGMTAGQISSELKENGILASGFDSRIRMVTHIDVSLEDMTKAISVLDTIIKKQLSAVS